MASLDVLDKKILGSLSRNPRKHFSAIAREVRSSKEVVNYRVKRLISKGVIRSFVTSFDFGYHSYKVLLHFEKITRKDEKALISFLEKHDLVTWVTPCFGHWDLAFVIMAKNPAHFDTVLREIVSRTGEYFHDYKFSITIGTKTYGDNYLLGRANSVRQKKVDHNASFDLDEKDKAIARLLHFNSRIKLSAISAKTKIPIDTVNYRIKKMEESGAIQYYRMVLDPISQGFQRFSVFISCSNLSDSVIKKFEEYANQHSNIAFYGRCVGGWDVEYTVYFNENSELRSFLLDLKSEFAGVVKKVESITLLRTTTYSYKPSEIYE